MAFSHPFSNGFQSFVDLLAHPLENLGVEAVGGVLAGRHKHTIDAFHDLACLGAMRCYAFGIHRILIYFDVWFDVVKILCCSCTFAL